MVIDVAANPGDHVRPAGGDLQRGQIVFETGTVLTPAHIGVLASLGIDDPLPSAPAVGVMSTGDELVVERMRRRGTDSASNRPMLLAVVAESSFEPVDYGIVRDDKDEIARRITTCGRRVRRAAHERRGVDG